MRKTYILTRKITGFCMGHLQTKWRCGRAGCIYVYQTVGPADNNIFIPYIILFENFEFN
jgi:hypothetical protein